MTLTSGSESSEIVENSFPEVICDINSSSLKGNPKAPTKQVIKPHQCDFTGCSAKFSRPWRLQAHKAVHLGKRPFPCDFENCEKSYTSNYHLRRHKITAHAIKQIITKFIKCRHPNCSKEFKTRQFEKKHFLRTHNEKTCQDCGKIFFKRSQLRKHLLSHKIGHPYLCDVCKMGFEHLFLLRRHQRSHVLHLCPVKGCMEAYHNWSSLSKHLKSHPYDFVCSYCKKGYRIKRFLEAHIIRHMNGIKRKQSKLEKLSCDLCQSVLVGKASLRRHIKKIHEAPSIKETQLQPSPSKPRAPRKDKGLPKKAFASVLSELEVPRDINARILKGVSDEHILENLFQGNITCLINEVDTE